MDQGCGDGLFALVRQWRSEEKRFRAWYAWVVEENKRVWESDLWMDEVGHFQQLLVDRDIESRDDRRDALLRFRRAHLFYPLFDEFQ